MDSPIFMPYNQKEVTDFLEIKPRLLYHAIVLGGVDIYNDSPNTIPHDQAIAIKCLINFLAKTWTRGTIFSIIAVQAFNGAILIMPTNTIFAAEPMLDEYITSYDIDYNLTFPALVMHYYHVKEEA